MPGMVRLPTGMGFEVDDDEGDDADASTFVNESVAPTQVAAKATPGDEQTQLTPPVLPPAPVITPSGTRRISEPVVPAAGTAAAAMRSEPEPAALLPPPIAPTYPSAAPYTQQQQYAAHTQPAPQQLAAGSSALKHEVVAAAAAPGGGAAARPFGDGSNITSPAVRPGETGDELVPAPARRKLPMAWLVGGGAAAAILLVAVIVIATRGGKSGEHGAASKREPEGASAKAVAAADERGSAASASQTPEPGPGTTAASHATDASDATKKSAGGKKAAGNGSAASAATASSGVETPAGTGSPNEATVASEPPTPPAPTPIPSPPPAVAKRPAPTLGGKKVVLEYDTQPKEPPKKVTAAATPAVRDENAVRTARTSYFNGNRKLFAGDANGAIKLYQQALSVYPGYVAGYRGLGLAYAQKGDKANALKAFRTYMSAVPTAKDIPLIKERVTALQKKK